MLERFGFTGDRLTARIGDLSGGERRRLQLLRLLLSEPNVLLLDEPTNDLDIETLNVLEDFLDGWPGTLVVVSHDRYFLERVTDSTWALLGDGQVSMLPRGVEEYLERRAQASLAAATAEARGSDSAGAVQARGSDGPRRRSSARPARPWPGSSGSSPGSPSASRRCTPRWSSTPPTTSGWPRSTYGCGRWPAQKAVLEEEWLDRRRPPRLTRPASPPTRHLLGP